MDVLRNSIDLNFLRVFDALMRERSVANAALQVGVSASAVSHALAGMRLQFRDELFVRTSTGMQPTARAMAMAENVREALLQVELAVTSTEFAPETATQTFTVAANDHITSVILPEVLAEVSRMAPGIDIVIRPSTRLDLAQQIDLGRIDLAISGFRSVPARFTCQTLLHDGEVAVTAKGHPLTGRPLEPGHLAEYPIVAVSVGGSEEGAQEGFIFERGLERRSEMYDRERLDNVLRTSGLNSRISLTVPHFLALPDLLFGTDRIAIVPRTLANYFCERRDLVAMTLPYPVEEIPLQAIWHSRNEKDLAHVWLRDLINRTIESIAGKRDALT